MIFPAAAYPRAVAADGQSAGPGVEAEESVAGALIKRGDEPEILPAAEVAPALPVRHAGAVGVGNKVIIAVAVHAVVPYRGARIREAGAAQAAAACLLRTGGPRLVAVYEYLLIGRNINVELRLCGDDDILRQIKRETPRAA